MKRIYKAIVFSLCLICLCISLSGCTYSFKESEDGRYAFGVSKLKKDVFCVSCVWDGGDMSFVIPDEFMGYKVTTLGGYTGTGVPSPFRVEIDCSIVYPDIEVCCLGEEFFEYLEDDEYDVFTFSVSIGANLVNIDYVEGKNYIAETGKNENGEVEYDVLCKIVYSFTVDEANAKLYSENGRLFYRESNELVNDFYYE